MKAMRNKISHLEELRSRAKSVEIVSFDFFDTLFERIVADPEDIFKLLERRLGIKNFFRLRKQAQTDAFIRMREKGAKEITLAEIYDCFPSGNYRISELIEAEIKLELDSVYPNHELATLYKELIDLGKRTIIISDMYLPEYFFRLALKNHNLPTVPLFISSQRNATKRDNAELFDLVLKETGADAADVLHIGDNPIGDVEKALSRGLQVHHYVDSSRLVVPDEIGLERSLLLGLNKKRRHELTGDYFHELGYKVAGPACYGLLKWLEKQTRTHRVDHLLFLSRDGNLFSQIAKQCHLKLPRYSYFYGSRTAFGSAVITEENFSEYVDFLLSGAEGLTPIDIFERIGAAPPSKKVVEDLELPKTFCNENADIFRTMLFAFKSPILAVSARNRRALYFYLNTLGIREAERVAIFDIGWSGTSQHYFKNVIDMLYPVEIIGYYFCLADTQQTKNRMASQEMYSFASVENTNGAALDLIYKNRVLCELLFSAPHETVIGWEVLDGEIRPVCDIRSQDASKYEAIANAIAFGARKFIDDFRGTNVNEIVNFDYAEFVAPLIEIVTNPKGVAEKLAGELSNFDDWVISENTKIKFNLQPPPMHDEKNLEIR
jgi:predicted HAD superfamily hydrolase